MKKIVIGILLTGAVLTAYPARGQDVIEEIVAIVNDQVITLSEYRAQFDQAIQQLRAQQLPTEEFDRQYLAVKRELLESLITDLLLLQKAKEQNLNVNEQLKGILDKIKQENNFTSEEDLRRAVQSQGLVYEVWLKQYEETLLRQSVIYSEVDRSIVLDDAEVVQYYKKNPKEFTQPAEYTLKAIYLSADTRTAPELEARKAEIDEKIQSGAALPDVAAELSDPPLKDAKGELGTFKKGELDKTLEEAVEKLKAGQTGPWTNARNGWYLLRLEDRKDSRLLPFDEARKAVEDKIFQGKRQAKVEEFLKNLREQSYVKILKPNPLGS